MPKSKSNKITRNASTLRSLLGKLPSRVTTICGDSFECLHKDFCPDRTLELYCVIDDCVNSIEEFLMTSLPDLMNARDSLEAVVVPYIEERKRIVRAISERKSGIKKAPK